MSTDTDTEIDIETFPRGDVVTATPDTTVADLASRMAEEEVGSIVIIDGDDRPVGMVTDRTLAVEVLAAGEEPSSVTAEDVMSEDVVTASVDDGIFDVLARMEEAEVRRIPAVDENGAVTAIVSFDDFVALFGHELEKLVNIVEAESPSYQK